MFRTFLTDLINAVRDLKFAHVADDFGDLFSCDIRQCRHVAIRPVMRRHALRDSAVKACIAVVTWFVNDVNEGRPLVGAGPIGAVAFLAVGFRTMPDLKTTGSSFLREKKEFRTLKIQ